MKRLSLDQEVGSVTWELGNEVNLWALAAISLPVAIT